jgi:hypothetical protein
LHFEGSAGHRENTISLCKRNDRPIASLVRHSSHQTRWPISALALFKHGVLCTRCGLRARTLIVPRI